MRRLLALIIAWVQVQASLPGVIVNYAPLPTPARRAYATAMSVSPVRPARIVDEAPDRSDHGRRDEMVGECCV